jgi:hypothetical protein
MGDDGGVANMIVSEKGELGGKASAEVASSVEIKNEGDDSWLDLSTSAAAPC